MLIAVKSCASHWDRCAAIRETWYTPLVHFFTGDELGVPDSYEALPLKTHAICKWAERRGHLWVFFCDTDTFIHVPRLMLSFGPDYTGYRLEGKDYASGGAGYWLSAKSMAKVAKGNPAKFTNEDEMVGALVGPPVHDKRFSLYDEVLPDNDIITRHLSSREPYKLEMMHEAHRKASE